MAIWKNFNSLLEYPAETPVKEPKTKEEMEKNVKYKDERETDLVLGDEGDDLLLQECNRQLQKVKEKEQ